MTNGLNYNEWEEVNRDLIKEMEYLGFSKELGREIAKNLGSPKAIRRMTAYLRYVKPKKEELVVDEMLAICSEINAWRAKKAGEEANYVITRMLNDPESGCDFDEDETTE